MIIIKSDGKMFLDFEAKKVVAEFFSILQEGDIFFVLKYLSINFKLVSLNLKSS